MSNPAVQEALRRFTLESSYADACDAMAGALDADVGLREMATVLYEVGEQVRELECVVSASEDEEDKRTSKSTTLMQALEKEVSPLLGLLKDDGPIRQAWKELSEHLDTGVALEGQIDVSAKRRRHQFGLQEWAEAISERTNPDALAELIKAALADDTYHESVWKALKEHFEEVAEPVEEDAE